MGVGPADTSCFYISKGYVEGQVECCGRFDGSDGRVHGCVGYSGLRGQIPMRPMHPWTYGTDGPIGPTDLGAPHSRRVERDLADAIEARRRARRRSRRAPSNRTARGRAQWRRGRRSGRDARRRAALRDRRAASRYFHRSRSTTAVIRKRAEAPAIPRLRRQVSRGREPRGGGGDSCKRMPRGVVVIEPPTESAHVERRDIDLAGMHRAAGRRRLQRRRDHRPCRVPIAARPTSGRRAWRPGRARAARDRIAATCGARRARRDNGISMSAGGGSRRRGGGYVLVGAGCRIARARLRKARSATRADG